MSVAPCLWLLEAMRWSGTGVCVANGWHPGHYDSAAVVPCSKAALCDLLAMVVTITGSSSVHFFLSVGVPPW